MKTFFFKTLIILSICLPSCEPKTTDNEFGHYIVYKIDSINSYYLVYAKRNDTLFKIVSKKENFQNCERIIEVNKNYNFKLHSYFDNLYSKKDTFSIIDLPHVSGFNIDSITVISFERDSINNIYYSSNLHGLCIKTFKK